MVTQDQGLANWMIEEAVLPRDQRIAAPHEMSEGPLDCETLGEWTDKLARLGSSAGVYRQCSIGYHDECSQADRGPDAECRCSCHG